MCLPSLPLLPVYPFLTPLVPFVPLSHILWSVPTNYYNYCVKLFKLHLSFSKTIPQFCISSVFIYTKFRPNYFFLLHPYLIKGVGNQLHYYHYTQRDHKKTTTTKFVLEDVLVERIHGICVASLDSGRHLIVCHGGKEFVQLILDGQCLTRCRSTAKRTSINDLISSSYMYKDGFEMALLSAHGVAVRMGLDWNGDGSRPAIIETAKCPDKSTLYCSHIVEDKAGPGGWLGSLFFGGTAFGELIVWRCVDGVPMIVLRMDCHKVSLKEFLN